MKERMLSLVGFSTQRNNLKAEVLAGLTTFVTMSYILALNPVLFEPLVEKRLSHRGPVHSNSTICHHR